MTKKIQFLNKFKKNRFLVLIISCIIITCVYYGVDKAISSCNFKSNSDIIESSNDSTNNKRIEKEDEKNWFEKLFNDNQENLEGENIEQDVTENGEVLDDENVENSNLEGGLEDEVDFETEGEEGSAEDSINADIDNLQNKSNEGDMQIEEKIYVYITGEVNIPGVVILSKGSRIVDAINSAGGTTSKANISKVNLVYVLEDGMKVNIPNNDELKNNPDFEYITMNSGDGASDGVVGKDNSNSDKFDKGSTSSGSKNYFSIVNINTATQTELESLPGIGPSLALNIINYRKENGMFSSVEDIKNVSGIGDMKFERLKNYITV